MGAVALRSRLMLACAAGRPENVVAEEFGLTPQTVDNWRARLIQRRLSGLTEERRPGARRKLTDDLVARNG